MASFRFLGTRISLTILDDADLQESSLPSSEEVGFDVGMALGPEEPEFKAPEANGCADPGLKFDAGPRPASPPDTVDVYVLVCFSRTLLSVSR
ncbi:uncharacterized protein BcabD6B2_05160 [Babesia caballi]|uniref:Uncharacterized protein n=1 Tax=Babesia caballi TaxID=5871 RepID=A0AAV4LM40_BABCB|nr:hypothetical protein BcabD6B2_05160 [Babesia caballi]